MTLSCVGWELRSSSLSTGRKEISRDGAGLWCTAKFHLTAFPFLLLQPFQNFGWVPASIFPKGKAVGLNVLLAALTVYPQLPAVMSPPCSSHNHGPQADIGPSP